MYHSSELRWFFEGGLPEPVLAWFTAGGHAVSEAPRVDEYLALPGCATVGVKLREGRFEVKALTGEPALVGLPNGFAGVRERWVKWSLAGAGALRVAIEQAGDEWVFVRKHRHVRKLALDGAVAEELPPGAEAPGGGCQIELTTLGALRGRQDGGVAAAGDWADAAACWWSLAFEAFGEPDRLDTHLARGAAALLEDGPPVRLGPADSLSYPAWLARQLAR